VGDDYTKDKQAAYQMLDGRCIAVTEEAPTGWGESQLSAIVRSVVKVLPVAGPLALLQNA